MVAGRVGLDTPSDAVEGECVYVLVIVKACMCVSRTGASAVVVVHIRCVRVRHVCAYEHMRTRV